MVSLDEALRGCYKMVEIVCLCGIMLFIRTVSVVLCIILPCSGLYEANFFKGWKAPVRSIFIFVFFFAILPFTVLS